MTELTAQEISEIKRKHFKYKLAAALTFANFLFTFFIDLYQRTGILFPVAFFKRSILVVDQIWYSLTGAVFFPLLVILIFSIFKIFRTANFRIYVFIIWSCFNVFLTLVSIPSESDELMIKDTQGYSEAFRAQHNGMMRELNESKR